MEILVNEYDAELLDNQINSYTVQITAKLEKINAFIDKVSQLGELQAIARSGSVAVSKGQVKLSSYEKHYPLTG
jgi:acetolactate synthase small subunit